MRVDPSLGAVEPDDPELQPARRAAAGGAVGFEKPLAIVGMDDVDDALADDLRDVLGAEHLEPGGVHLQQQPVG